MTTENAEFIPGDEEQPTAIIDFNVNDARIAEAAEQFKDVDAYQDLDEAKAAKKILTKMRTTLAAAHKEQKAESLAYGRRLDGEKNRLLALIAEIEDPITTQLDDIKNAEKRKEEERLAAIQTHLDRLASYALDRHDLSIEQLQERLENLEQETFEEERYQEKLDAAKVVAHDSKSKLTICLLREEENQKQLEEIARTKKKQEEAQRKLDEQQKELDRLAEEQRKAQEEEARKAREEQERKDAERQAELDRQAEEQAERQRKLDEAEAAKRAEQEAEEAREAELMKAPDRDKLTDFAANLDALNERRPQMQSQEGMNTMLHVSMQIERLVKTIRDCVEEMK